MAAAEAALALEVRAYDLSARGELSLGGLARYFEQARWAAFADPRFAGHSFTRGVVRAQRVSLLSPVGLGQATLRTWLVRVGNSSLDLVAYLEQGGERCAMQRCTLVALDDNGPVRLPRSLEAHLGAPEAFEPGALEFPVGKLESFASGAEFQQQILLTDIDIFQHMNQARYIDYFDSARVALAEELGLLSLQPLRRISVSYEREVKLGASARIAAAVAPDGGLRMTLFLGDEPMSQAWCSDAF